MSILETFYILFKSNADEVDKGTKKAKTSIEKFSQSLTDSKKRTEAVGEGFVSIVEGAAGALAGILAVGKAIQTVNETIQQTQNLRLASMATGNTAQQIDQINRATQRFGGTAEETTGVIKNLNSQILDTAFSGDGALSPILRRLGLNLRNMQGDIVKPVELLDSLNKSFQRVSKRESMDLGTKMGLSESMILLLQQTPEAYRKSIEAAKKWGAVTAQDVEATNKLDMSINDFNASMGEATRRMVFSMVPALNKFFDGVNNIFDFIKDNGDLVKGFFIGTAAIITGFYLPAIVSAGVATWAALAPIIAMTAAVVAVGALFALLYDDVMHFARGSKSSLGDAVKRWPILGVIIEHIVAAFRSMIAVLVLLKDAFVSAFGFIYDTITDLPGAWDKFTSAIKNSNAVEFIAEKFKNLGDFIAAIFTKAGKIITGIMDTITASIQYVVDKISNLRGMMGGSDAASIMDSMSKAKSATDFAAASPLASQTSAAISGAGVLGGKTFDMRFGDITINTQATDPQGVSLAVSQSLATHMKQALYNIDDGVLS